MIKYRKQLFWKSIYVQRITLKYSYILYGDIILFHLQFSDIPDMQEEESPYFHHYIFKLQYETPGRIGNTHLAVFIQVISLIWVLSASSNTQEETKIWITGKCLKSLENLLAE